MSDSTLLSIVIPVHNLASYLGDCLDSILVTPFGGFEVICVNDGSEDASTEILRHYAQRDSRVSVFEGKCKGVSAARNFGIERSVGRYIAFVDADDTVAEGYISQLLAWAETEDADIYVFSAETRPYLQWMAETLDTPDRTVEGMDACIDALFATRGCIPNIWNKMYRRALLEEHHLRLDESLWLGEDNAFQFSVFPCAHRVVFSSKKLYRYRTSRAGSAVTATGDLARVCAHLDVVESIARAWCEQGIFEKNRVRLLQCLDFLFFDAFDLKVSELRDFSKGFHAMFQRHFREEDLEQLDTRAKDIYQLLLKLSQVSAVQARLLVARFKA